MGRERRGDVVDASLYWFQQHPWDSTSSIQIVKFYKRLHYPYSENIFTGGMNFKEHGNPILGSVFSKCLDFVFYVYTI